MINSLKPTETQSKAVAAALSGFLVAFVPLLVSSMSGEGVTADQMLTFKNSITMLFSTIVSYLFVYFAPKNQALPPKPKV